METAVSAMANPISAFLIKALAITLRTGEPGNSNSAVKIQAEIMKIPSSAPSIKNSGQCRANEWLALRASDARFSRAGVDALTLRCATRAGEMLVSVTRDRIRMGVISDKDRQKEYSGEREVCCL